MTELSVKVRQPVVAGRFYESGPDACRRQVQQLSAGYPALTLLPKKVCGALLPHAGWLCSGRVAASTVKELTVRTDATTFVLLGAVHTMAMARPAIDVHGHWQTPLGRVPVDATLRQQLASLSSMTVDGRPHRQEHSLEVVLPMLQFHVGHALRIVPIAVPPSEQAMAWGRSIGQLLAGWYEPVAVIGSTDLTHYGPNYRFTPHGSGEAGIRWAEQENDRRLIEYMTAMDGDNAMAHSREHHSACGGGAIAATIGATAALGAGAGYLLEHTNSVRELAQMGYRDRSNAVGYAGILFG